MLKATARRLHRLIISALVLAGLSFALLVLGLRYWLLPNIAEYREDIAASISRAAGQRVTIGAIGAGWDGLRPHLSLRQLEVYDHQDKSALTLEHIEGTLAWWGLALGEIRLHSLEIDQPNLILRRTVNGEIYVGGVWINQPGSESGFADWVLGQHRIIVRDATLSWRDELRQAQPLELANVNLRVENRGHRHRFGLRAVPPRSLALPLDLRGDLRGDSLRDLSGWEGTLYARLDYADIAAGRTWLDLPFQLERGSGGVRAWLTLGEKQLRGVIADVQLDDVLARLAPDLPQLDLAHLGGRISWRDLDPGQSLQTSKLSFGLRNGLSFSQSDFRLKAIPAQKRKPAQGELALDSLALEPLAVLADYLPLDAEIREKLRRVQPKGTLSDLSLRWTGDWPSAEHYTLKGKFADLAARAYTLPDGNSLPGFSGLSGNLDASEEGGKMVLNSSLFKLDLPGVFDHALGLDTLAAQVAWTRTGEQLAFRLTGAKLANSHLAGTASGSFRTSASGMGEIDLSAQFNRADARFVSFYMPLVVGKDTRDWLEQSLKAGHASDVRLRLKGDLGKFPFEDGKSGIFEVSVKAAGGVLEYAPEWPAIENIKVDLLFRGKGMDILAHSGHTYGMQIQKVHARIPDLLHGDELLAIDGEARGPSGDMLKFIAQSPVNAMLDGFTEDMGAAGNGKFNLSLKIPLRRVNDMTVAGSYLFQNNKVMLGEGMPTLEKVNGTLQFTGAALSIPGITGLALGGAVSISAATQQDVVQVNVGGKASAAGLLAAFGHPALEHLQGSTKWNGQISLRKKLVNAVFTSNLQGLASDLPTPLNKAAAESVPFRLERKTGSADQDSISFGYGRVLTGQLERRLNGGGMKVERGVINLGNRPMKLPPAGIWFTASLPTLDLDHWREQFGGKSDKGATLPVDNINLNVGVLDAFGKRFSEFKLNAKAQGETWQAALESREMNGSVSWNHVGAGRVVGRFRTLSLPPSAPPKLEAPKEPGEVSETDDLPALDIVAENFALRQKQLGRLEVLAAPSGRDWRIEKLKLNTPESTLILDGVWQDWLQQPRSRVNLQLETGDVGKLLARLGYPDSVRGGNAKLKGQFYWSGSPAEFNFASLTGLMSLEAHKGQFLKVEPGIGKLLGVLSLQALPRRITLDFRDVFSDGFAFDEISGNVKVNQGIVSGNDFRMEGPAAKVAMSGETDLNHETQNLKVRVVPVLGDTVSGAATLLGGPVVGLASLLVQKVLKDPIGQIAAYEYSITGTWDNPVVTKLRKSTVEGGSWDAN